MQAECRGKIVVFRTTVVDLGDQGGQTDAAFGSNGFQFMPEFIFQRKTRSMTVQGRRMFSDQV